MIVFYEFYVNYEARGPASVWSGAQEWSKTEKGKWCREHAVSGIKVHTEKNWARNRAQVAICGELISEDQTYYLLKWGSQ